VTKFQQSLNNFIVFFILCVCTGGLGQLGLTMAKLLRSKYGDENVLLSDIIKPNQEIVDSGPYIFADILDFKVKDFLKIKLEFLYIFFS
jgi:hypothetical protein